MKPPSETTAVMDLTPRDLEDLVEELRASHALSSPVFQRREQRAHAAKYLQGLLLELPRKSIEPLVLALEGAKSHAVRAMQQCISEGSWADTVLLPRHWHEVARFARVRVLAVREGLPGPDVWLVLRHHGGTGELKTYLSHAPAQTALATWVRVSGMRWPIETCCKDGTQDLGMGEDEVAQLARVASPYDPRDPSPWLSGPNAAQIKKRRA